MHKNKGLQCSLVSGAELARMLGCSRQAIHRARLDGRLTVASRDNKGHPLYDPDQARQQYQPDPVQAIRPVVGGRPKKDRIRSIEVDATKQDDPAVDAIVAAAIEARQWLATASPAEIEHCRAATLARMDEFAARHRRHRDRTGQWPVGWPSWREFTGLEIRLLELDGIDTGKVPP